MNYEKVKQENGSSLNVCLKFVYSSFVFIQILKSDSDIFSYSVISQLFQQCLFFAILSIYIIFDGEITISTEKVLWINNEGNWFFIGKSLWKSDTAFHFFGTNREFSSRVVKKRLFQWLVMCQTQIFRTLNLLKYMKNVTIWTQNLRSKYLKFKPDEPRIYQTELNYNIQTCSADLYFWCMNAKKKSHRLSPLFL